MECVNTQATIGVIVGVCIRATCGVGRTMPAIALTRRFSLHVVGPMIDGKM